MKLDFSQELVNPLDGNPVWETETQEKVSTLGSVCIQALMSNLKGDETLDGNKKFGLYELAKKIKDGEDDLKIEELATIKDRVGRAFSSLMVGIVYDILDK